MDFLQIIVIFLIGLAGSFISGLLGIGGAIINYPMLLYIPVLLGSGSFTAHEVSAITAIQVFFASIGGVWAYRKSGFLNKALILSMGAGVLAGSFAGGAVSAYLTESGINAVYGLLAILAVVLMFLPRKNVDDQSIQFNRWLAAILAFIVGVGAGIVGAGGAFLLVPIMLTVLNIPTRAAVASSLAITLVSSVGTVAGKIGAGGIPLLPSLIMVVASLIASPLGVKLGKKMNTKILQRILAIVILAAAIKIWFEIL